MKITIKEYREMTSNLRNKSLEEDIKLDKIYEDFSRRFDVIDNLWGDGVPEVTSEDTEINDLLKDVNNLTVYRVVSWTI